MSSALSIGPHALKILLDPLVIYIVTMANKVVALAHVGATITISSTGMLKMYDVMGDMCTQMLGLGMSGCLSMHTHEPPTIPARVARLFLCSSHWRAPCRTLGPGLCHTLSYPYP